MRRGVDLKLIREVSLQSSHSLNFVSNKKIKELWVCCFLKELFGIKLMEFIEFVLEYTGETDVEELLRQEKPE